MAYEIKAIETSYDYHRFRSRLEARWAVFFNTMKIEYRYEPQGFHLENRVGWLDHMTKVLTFNYLPDFYLPKFKCWCEAKPTAFTNEERIKCMFLCEATKERVIMLDGEPAFKEYEYFEYQSEASRETFEKDGRLFPYDRPAGAYQDVYLALISNWFDEDRFGVMMGYGDDAQSYGEDYNASVKAALSARFEFGEHGTNGRH